MIKFTHTTQTLDLQVIYLNQVMGAFTGWDTKDRFIIVQAMMNCLNSLDITKRTVTVKFGGV